MATVVKVLKCELVGFPGAPSPYKDWAFVSAVSLSRACDDCPVSNLVLRYGLDNRWKPMMTLTFDGGKTFPEMSMGDLLLRLLGHNDDLEQVYFPAKWAQIAKEGHEARVESERRAKLVRKWGRKVLADFKRTHEVYAVHAFGPALGIDWPEYPDELLEWLRGRVQVVLAKKRFGPDIHERTDCTGTLVIWNPGRCETEIIGGPEVKSTRVRRREANFLVIYTEDTDDGYQRSFILRTAEKYR